MLALRESFIVDDKGKKISAVLPYAVWKKVSAILEEYDDICAYDKVKSRASNPVSFKEAVQKLKASRS
jgi:hypothetical protein